MNYQDISALISIRQFSYNVLDNPAIKLGKEQLKLLGSKLSELDNLIVSSILETKFNRAEVEHTVLPVENMPSVPSAPVKIDSAAKGSFRKSK